MERNAQHNEHNIFGQIVPRKTRKGKLVLQMENILTSTNQEIQTSLPLTSRIQITS